MASCKSPVQADFPAWTLVYTTFVPPWSEVPLPMASQLRHKYTQPFQLIRTESHVNVPTAYDCCVACINTLLCGGTVGYSSEGVCFLHVQGGNTCSQSDQAYQLSLSTPPQTQVVVLTIPVADIAGINISKVSSTNDQYCIVELASERRVACCYILSSCAQVLATTN
jgi:hypothetical protein